MPDARVDLGPVAYKSDTLPTELPRPVSYYCEGLLFTVIYKMLGYNHDFLLSYLSFSTDTINYL